MEARRGSGSVHIQLGASGAEGTEGPTHDFCSWLRQTADIREHADISLRTASRGTSETMGTVEIIDLALGHGFAALNLALAYASWRNARPSAPTVTLTTSRGSVTVRDGSEEEIRRIVAALDGVGGADDADADRDAGEGRDGEQGSPGSR
ncbi:effector-associated constant component EACC1 [Streptomyces axinellae]|uniref:Uncharacterized protein n=1 Tax=Streptomyces axinellae TaxID=552788 RepID=A0ABN3Q1Y0_9ACTN